MHGSFGDVEARGERDLVGHAAANLQGRRARRAASRQPNVVHRGVHQSGGPARRLHARLSQPLRPSAARGRRALRRCRGSPAIAATSTARSPSRAGRAYHREPSANSIGAIGASRRSATAGRSNQRARDRWCDGPRGTISVDRPVGRFVDLGHGESPPDCRPADIAGDAARLSGLVGLPRGARGRRKACPWR